MYKLSIDQGAFGTVDATENFNEFKSLVISTLDDSVTLVEITKKAVSNNDTALSGKNVILPEDNDASYLKGNPTLTK